jgi:hypothetical protein
MKKLSKVIIIFIVLLSLNGFLDVFASDYGFTFNFITDEANNKIVTGIQMGSPNRYQDSLNRDVLDGNVSRGHAWNILLERYKIFIVGVTGVVTITLIAVGMFGFSSLSASADNPQKRNEALWQIGITFLAAMILGIGTLIFSYAYNVF